MLSFGPSVGEVAMGLASSGRELDAKVDGSCRRDVARCCFAEGSVTTSSVMSVCCQRLV